MSADLERAAMDTGKDSHFTGITHNGTPRTVKRQKGEYCVERLTVVIPTLNEEEGIAVTIVGIPLRKLEAMGYSVEVIVVDGNSRDLTREIASNLGARVMIEPELGYGKAYKTGFENARGDILVTMDADGSYPAQIIPECLLRLKQMDLDFISVQRQLSWATMSTVHRVGNFILTILVRALFRIRLSDSQSGMWIFRRSALRTIMPRSDGMSFSQEIKIRAFLNVRACEIPGALRNRRGTAKIRTFKDGFASLVDLFKLWLFLRNSRLPEGEHMRL